ncbi:hypothetical protein TNCT_37751 [Trichonephila clavata]|uniref:Uncharacterized protein n=1 Tax=Trichonephila clavata TaxID=2740835 RepID=A0A8X6I7S5_TRICU|nr:hypothetical protein TNCT_37751 [Trichonephila clavata]
MSKNTLQLETQVFKKSRAVILLLWNCSFKITKEKDRSSPADAESETRNKRDLIDKGEILFKPTSLEKKKY